MIRWARAPRGRLTVLLSAAMSLMAAAGAHAQQPAAEPVLLIQLGAQLFQREGCPLCHRIRGEGGAVGPALDDVAARQPDLQWYLRFLREPTAVMEGAVMPAYGQLSENQRTALATFLLNLRGVCAPGSRSRDC
jgi:mono/diheme cytochrome c family protein